MQDMTPEERFTRIENLLATVAENQVRRDAEMEQHAAAIARQNAAIDKQNAAIDKQNAAIDKQNAAIDKHTAAIRDLILISGTFVDSHKRTEAEIDKLRESIEAMRERQEATDEKLHILIETVDRIIRNK